MRVSGDPLISAKRFVGVFNRSRHCIFVLAMINTLAMAPEKTFGQFDLSEIGYDGFAEAIDDIMVSAFESGRVESVLVKVGDRVKAGQVLATLEQTAQHIAVESAATVAAMRGSLDLAAADLALHELRLKQLKKLASEKNARPEEVDRAEAELQMSSARFLNAKEEVAQREVELKHATEQLRRRQVISPIDGVVAKVFVDIGEYVLPSDLTVVRVINSSALKAVFNVPATEATRMSVGQVVRVEFTSMARSAEGEIHTIAPLIDADSSTIPVTVRIDNTSQRWMAGDRCLMDPVVRPKPNRTSLLMPDSRDGTARDHRNGNQSQPSKERVSILVSAESVRITDLPNRNSTEKPNDEKSR
jgi:RND family efflux transporter MFP subunit